MSVSRLISYLIWSSFFVLLSACSSTQIINVWQAPTPTTTTVAHPLHKILVLAIAPDGGIRRTFEDSVSQALQGIGIQAEPVYLFSQEDKPLSQADWSKVIDKAQAQGILTIRLLGIQREVNVIPSQPMLTGFYGFYQNVWFTPPPTVQTYNVAIMESNLWGGQQFQQLLWSGTTESMNPSEIKQTAQDLSKVLANTVGKSVWLLPQHPKKVMP